MDGNPYADLLNIVQKETKGAPPAFYFGTVLSAVPLKIRIANLDYEGEELIVNDLLTASIPVGDATWKRPLSAGDRVICLPEDSSFAVWIVLCRVVGI